RLRGGVEGVVGDEHRRAPALADGYFITRPRPRLLGGRPSSRVFPFPTVLGEAGMTKHDDDFVEKFLVPWNGHDVDGALSLMDRRLYLGDHAGSGTARHPLQRK